MKKLKLQFSILFQKNTMEFRPRRKGIVMQPKRQIETEHPIVEDITNETIFQPPKAITDKAKIDRLRQGIRNLYGRHYPIKAKPAYNFMEQWQSKPISFDLNNYREAIQAETLPAYVYTAIMLLAHIALFWYFSTSHIRSLTDLIKIEMVSSFGILTVVVDSAVRFYLEYLRVPSRQGWQWRELLKKFKGEGYLIMYYLINLALEGKSYNDMVIYLMDAVAVYLIYKRSKELFQLFKIRSYTTVYKHKMKLVDLLGTLLFFLHIFVTDTSIKALLLYLASFSDPSQNWTGKVSQPPPEGLDRYFYAFYFAATTMLTIGYGDLSPTNKVQILAILPVQIFGVAIFSYIISEIGYTVGSVRKEEEQLEHNLSTLSKMEKFYHMEEDISNIAKHNLVSSQKNSEIVYPEDQQAVLAKLNDQLRDSTLQSNIAVQFNNGLDIVKSSLFFLCHWTKHFQASVAKNLTKKILHPNQLLLQVPGKEKIYVVRNGKMQIYTNCTKHYKQEFKKLLKTIEPQNQLVADNIYGYTSVITARNVRLAAVSKEFTSVYFIDKEKFLSCINDTQLDREYFFEIRDKIEQSKSLESFEAPAVLNIRYHYRPSQFFVLKKHTEHLKKYSNQRAFYRRSNNAMHCKIGNVEVVKITKSLEETLHDRTGKAIESCKSYSVDYYPKEILVEMFEISREYSNFFRRSNLTCILSKLERENPKIPKSTYSNQPNYPSNTYNLLIE